MARTAAKFVQIIEKYPCLYNHNLAEYGRKDITETAWNEVANEIHWSVNDCKEKWKNMRNGFVRSLKPKANGLTTTRKKYYLHDKMQFILPFIKPVIFMEEIGNVSCPERVTLNEEQKIFDSDKIIKEEIDSESVTNIEEPSFQKRKRRIKPANKAFANRLRTKTKDDDPRKMFLLSLLPDIRRLSDAEMSAFRIKMLLLLEEVKTPMSSV